MVPTIRSDILPHSAVGEMFLGGDIEVDETSFGGSERANGESDCNIPIKL